MRGRGQLAGCGAVGLRKVGQSLMGSHCSHAFTQFITSRKNAPKKEQVTVPVSFSLNIEGPRRSKTILERELQGGEEKVLCTPEEMEGRTNNIVLM